MKNIGKSEQRYRYLWSLLALGIAWFAPGLWGELLAGLAAYLAVTAKVRFCPLWWFFGLDTREIGSIDVVPLDFVPLEPKPQHPQEKTHDGHGLRKSA